MRTKNSSYKRGVALFVALALLFLLSVCTAVVLLTTYNYANISENQIKRLRAMKISEAGINYAYWMIREGSLSYPCTLTPPISLPADWSISVDITENGATGTKTIRSKVTY
ncbi:MAG: hypothetical protein KKC66_02310 [Candidatus Omnitrophica bacterium]|nr:hypothetical protein [Candidatus Omnitrophota bacterium]MBU1932716.1 hypothetical protein [Candidatus Omnitrophota bacterium]